MFNLNIKSLDQIKKMDWQSFGYYLRNLSLKKFSQHEPVFKKLLGSKPHEKPEDAGLHYGFQYSAFETRTSLTKSGHYFEYTPPSLVKQMFERVSLKRNSTFLDIGSGDGKVNIMAGLMQPGLRKNIGVELHEGLTQKSIQFVQKNKYPYAIEFIREDIFRTAGLFSEADVSYHYMNFDEDGILALIDLWKKHARPGSVFILNDSEANMDYYRDLKRVSLEVITDKRFQNYDHYLYVFTKR